jgi:hypothetical protein
VLSVAGTIVVPDSVPVPVPVPVPELVLEPEFVLEPEWVLEPVLEWVSSSQVPSPPVRIQRFESFRVSNHSKTLRNS